MPCNGDNVGIFKVNFESVHGGEREMYVRACSEAEAKAQFNGRADEGFAAYEGKVGQWDYEDDIRQKLNLDNSISFT